MRLQALRSNPLIAELDYILDELTQQQRTKQAHMLHLQQEAAAMAKQTIQL
jgi:hypothetical protein